MAITGGVAGPTIGIVGPLPPQGGDAIQSISLAGNTVGDTNISGSQIVIAGGNNITLSGDSAAHEIIISAGAAGGTFTEGISNLGNTAGTSGVITGSALQFVLAGGNNVTLSQSINGSSATITISGGAQGGTFTQGISNLGNTAGTSGTITGSALQLIFAGGNNVTLSQSINGSSATITVSGANTVAQTNQTIGVYASSQTTGQSSSSTIDARSFTHVGQGNISVGMSGGSLLISGKNDSNTLGISNIGNTAGTSGVITGSALQLVLAGGNNVTLSQSINGSSATVTISGANTVAQTNQTIGLYASSQTTGQSSSSTVDARSITFVGAGQVSVGLSGGSYLISATTAAQTNQTLGIYASSQTTGQSSSSTVDARSFTHVGQGIVSVGMSGGSLLISATQSNQTEGFYAVGNTTAQSSSTTIDARTLSIQGAGAVSVGYSAGSLIISGAGAGAGATQTAGISNLGNTSGTSGVITGTGIQFILAGGNNITLSQSINGSSATITISGVNTVAQTNQTLGEYALGNTTGQSSSTTTDARSVSIAGQGIISVGYSAGSNLIISATQSNQSIGVYASSQTTGQSSSSTIDARSFTHVGQGIVSVGMSGGSLLISATTTQSNQSLGVYASSQTTGQSSSSTVDARSFTHVGQGIVSVGMSGGSLLISATTTQTNQTIGLYASSQTTGQSSSSTVDARSITFVGAGQVSVGLSQGSYYISATTAAQTNQTIGLYASSQTTGQSSSSTVDARSITFVGQGDVTVGLSAGSYLISGDPFTRPAFIEANYGGL